MSAPPLEKLVLSVDLTLFTLDRRQEQVLLLLSRREAEPFAGALGLPGVAMQVDETLEQAARRALVRKAGLAPALAAAVHLEQLYTFDALYRDPRGRTLSVTYLGLLPAPEEGEPGSGAGAGAGSPASWLPIAALDRGALPFDHAAILERALSRLRGKLRYTNIASRLLPPTFRIEELQAVYEALLGRPLNRANFRNKLLKIGLIRRTGELPEAVGQAGGRPPHLYRFSDQGVEAQERDFL